MSDGTTNETHHSWARTLFGTRREALLLGTGVLCAVLVGVGLSGVVTTTGPASPPREGPPESEDGPEVPVELSPGECLKAYEGFVAEGRLQEAKDLLETGLGRVPVEDHMLRARFFSLLAEVSRKLDLPNAASVYRANSERLTLRSRDVMTLIEDAREASADGDHSTARRMLAAVLLRQGGLGLERETIVPRVHRSYAEAWYRAFTALQGEELEVAESPVTFGDKP